MPLGCGLRAVCALFHLILQQSCEAESISANFIRKEVKAQGGLRNWARLCRIRCPSGAGNRQPASVAPHCLLLSKKTEVLLGIFFRKGDSLHG